MICILYIILYIIKLGSKTTELIQFVQFSNILIGMLFVFLFCIYLNVVCVCNGKVLYLDIHTIRQKKKILDLDRMDLEVVRQKIYLPMCS